MELGFSPDRMNLDESRDERGGQKGNVWTRAGAREMRERDLDRSSHYVSFLFLFVPV